MKNKGDQGEKQIKAFKEHGKQLGKTDKNNQLLFSNKTKMFLKRLIPKKLKK